MSNSPVNITNNIVIAESPKPVQQQRQIPPQSIQAELVEHESVGTFQVPRQPGIDPDSVRYAIALTCMFAALLLFISWIKSPSNESEQTNTEGLSAEQVDQLIEDARKDWELEQQQKENAQLEAEYQGFKDGVIYRGHGE